MGEMKVFSGNANPALARAVVEYLDIPLGKSEVFEFSNVYWKMSANEMYLLFNPSASR